MVKEKKEVHYELYLENNPLGLEPHGEGTMIFTVVSEEDQIFKAKTFEMALSAICDNFFFHHGCGDLITPSTVAKERLGIIKIIKVEEVIHYEEVDPRLMSIPNNGQMAEYYEKGKGDFDLKRFIQVGRHKEDDYDLIDSFRLKGYNEWVKLGKPLSKKYLNGGNSNEEVR